MTGGNYEFLGIPKIRFRGGKTAEIEKEIRAVNEEEQGYKTRDTSITFSLNNYRWFACKIEIFPLMYHWFLINFIYTF